MNAQLAPEDSGIEPAPDGAQALLRSVVITDLCDSTALVDRLGDVRATELIRAHDRLLRGLIREHRGQEIDKTDGFLSLFERPIQAVAFALAYQRGLRAFSLGHGVEISARIGLHVGEVMTWQNDEADVAKGAKPTEVEGLAKPVAARLMGMALPGQILLSGVAYTLAHRAEGELGAALSRLQWKAHGDFRFKGVAEAVPVYEIGEEGIASFKAPAWSGKAHREVPLWRRPVMLAFEAIALIAALALPAWHFLKPEPAIAFAERDWVVLADLRNLTGDPRFDDSLEQAFRIGLEQSRHVNVLSDLQVRDTLQRMQRDSDSPVDRSVGAEIAMREGARALVLPTLAEVGGRLRFTAEVIHPNTQATVYSEYADGRGAEAVLPLVDEVNRKLRERLGEAVAQVETDSRPLERVATADLDALRSYTRAIELIDEGRSADAMALLRRALEIDQEFARAELELGVLSYNHGDQRSAAEHFQNSVLTGERLSKRELRLAQSWLATLSSTQLEAMRAWRLLDLEYPDYFAASGALAWNLWIYENNAQAAIDALSRNTQNANPRRAHGLFLLGSILVAQEQFEQAENAFERAASAGLRVGPSFLARLHAAKGEFSRASDLLNLDTSASAGIRASIANVKSGIALDQGDYQGSHSELLRLYASLDDEDMAPKRHLAEALSGLEAVGISTPQLETADASQHLRELKALLERLRESGGMDSAAAVSKQVRRIWIDRLSGRLTEIAPHLAALDQASVISEYPHLAHWTTVLKAEDELQKGNSEAALALLKELLGETESVASRFIATRALATSNEHEATLDSARQLYSRRGKAYSELFGSHAMLPMNVLMADYGHCIAKKAAAETGDPEAKRIEESRFRRATHTIDSQSGAETKLCSLFTASTRATSAG